MPRIRQFVDRRKKEKGSNTVATLKRQLYQNEMETEMNDTSDAKIMLVGASLFGIAVLLTPIAGIWIWLALGLGAWISWLCVEQVETAFGH